MSNFTSTIEYKFKVTNNLDKDNAQQKKFNFYLGLPYSKRKYRYMQVVNFATNKERQHLFNVVLGQSESSVAAMTEDILRGTHASLKPAVTKVMRITYASVNVGQVAFLCNTSNKETFEGADWTGISGEYTKIKSFRTNGNDEVIGLIFDAADRNIVSARKNDGTNVVAKPDIVKVPQPEKPVIDVDKVKLDPVLLTSTAREAIRDSVANLRKTNRELAQKIEEKEKDICALIEQIDEKDRTIKALIEERGFLQEDLANRDNDIEMLSSENADLHNQLKEVGSKPDETEKTFRGKFIDMIVGIFREKLEALSDDELLMYERK